MTEQITRRAEIDMIGYDVSDDPETNENIAIRWAKLTYAGTQLLSREYHRMLLTPADDIDESMAAVNVDLLRQGFGKMPDSDIDLVKAQVRLIRGTAT